MVMPYKACHGKEYEGLDESSRKVEIQKELSISIHLSEILTNELHKYIYPILRFIYLLIINPS